MKAAVQDLAFVAEAEATALEGDFPIVEVSQLAEQESWRKEINRPLYHIHKWWATRLGTVFRAITLGALGGPDDRIWQGFYRRHDFAGKVVLDPFMGSGTTLGEGIKLGAEVVGCDINPLSSFLVRQALTRVEEGELRGALDELERRVGTEIKRYYQTRDPLTGELLPVLYFFWVKTVETPEGETVALFDRYVFAQDAYPRKKPRAQILCPSCWQIQEDRFDVADLTCHHCGSRFNPQQGPASGPYVTSRAGQRYRIKDLLPAEGHPPAHRLYALIAVRHDGEKVYLPARPWDLALYQEAGARLATEALPIPTLAVRPGHNTNQARGYNYHRWRDFFNDRQLLCLGLLLRAILELEDQQIQEQMLCLFSGTLEFNNIFCSFKGEGTGAVRHMFSHHILKPERTPLENCVWGWEKGSGTFRSLFESRLLRAKRYLDEPFEVAFEVDLFGQRRGVQRVVASERMRVSLASSWAELREAGQGALVLCGDSACLPLPDRSVDAVVTDPPYFDFVHYSELSDFFFAWLAPVLRDRYPWFGRPDSSDRSEVQDKDPKVFSRQLARVFTECRRVLKDEGVLVFSFHHSRPEGWAAIHEALVESGFCLVAAHPVHGELRASSPKVAATEPISLDAMLVCRKRGAEQEEPPDLACVLSSTAALSARLEIGGMKLSQADLFVIAASQALVGRAGSGKGFDETVALLDGLRQRLG